MAPTTTRDMPNDTDTIEVVTEREGNILPHNNNQNHSMIIETKLRERRSAIRPYASSSSRIVKKCGKCNVEKEKIPNKESRYIKDIGNTLLNTRWRWILVSLCIANGLAYVTFASMWMLMAIINDDSENDGSETLPCIIGANTFTGYLLLSIETLSTIGFGVIYPTECQPSWIIITLQALTGVAIEGALVTAVFVKMSRPYNKDPMSLFSKKAVISMRDGILCLIFRIRDLHGKHWAKTTIKAFLIKRRNSPEGEPLPYYFEPIKLDKHGLLFWPQEIVHRITPNSPLWTLGPNNLYKSRFEIVIILEGDSITTGQPSQSQTSYMNKEISWGYRFVPCVEYDKEEQKYVIHNEKFHDLIECDTPLCSAEELDAVLKGVTLKINDLWDTDITSSLSTPISRRSETSTISSFRFPSYRMKKNDMDGINRDNIYTRQYSGATLETINSVENLVASNTSLQKDEKDNKEYLSTNL